MLGDFRLILKTTTYLYPHTYIFYIFCEILSTLLQWKLSKRQSHEVSTMLDDVAQPLIGYVMEGK